MTKIFQDIDISWKGKKYQISGDEAIMPLLAKIEDIITVQELLSCLSEGKTPLIKISMAFAHVLNYLGVQISQAEVYDSIFPNPSDQERASVAITTLSKMLLPPSFFENLEQEVKKDNSKKLKKSKSTEKTQEAL